ncbi:uncharacterized protein LOC122234189 isoform X3 [Panthera tigris]|uniref:uncharacterized protein LOC122234189 isoform X3 n=1 Tax=Panthera tigris TaxID=9694 RepID=UPI001C6F85B5|nr:uncharacterized protein LOC122234189 isoform X3 [Panthera tigris]
MRGVSKVVWEKRAVRPRLEEHGWPVRDAFALEDAGRLLGVIQQRREVAVASGNRAGKSQGPSEFSNLSRLLSQVMSQPAPVPLTRAGGRPWPPSEQTLSLFRERVAWEGKLQKELKTQCHGQLFYCEHGTF